MSLALLVVLGVPASMSAIGDQVQTAEFGAVPGHWSLTSEGFRDRWQPDAGYGPGIYAVPLGADRLLAFDRDSATTGVCSRVDAKPFTLRHDSRAFYRFRCDGHWDSRNVMFVQGTALIPGQGEKLEWRPAAASLLKLSASNAGDAVHSYTATASPRLLHGDVLVSSAWFSGEYPPRREPDDSRGDEIAFGHYRLLDRILFIGPSPVKLRTVIYRASDPKDVSEGFEWSFLPDDASEKTGSRCDAIYEIPNGYLLRISQATDFEGAGATESDQLYTFEAGQLRLFASASRTRMY